MVNRSDISRLCIVAAVAACFVAIGGDLHACTLWGAAGGDASGGTILAKNRDWAPDHTQVLKMHRGKGYAYFGLYAEGGGEPGIKCGVNEHGLSVITASASSIPKDRRASQPGKHGIISTILSGCASCDEVLAKKDAIFPSSRTMFVMISDRRKIVLVEVGLDGKYVLKTADSGAVVHTNHFLEPALGEFNIKIGPSSATRLARIGELMKTSPRPCRLDAMAGISRDQHDGPDNSLWRTGSKERTMASWIIETPPQGAPKLRVVIANPGQKEETSTLVLDEQFWRTIK
jgi:isopenicillin-N N-acyltransferase like protein